MLTSFIRRNGKKKGPKQPRIWPSPQRRPPLSPESFESPEILEINEKSIYAPPEEIYSHFVELELSTEPWFPEELLHARRFSKASTGAASSRVTQSQPDKGNVHDLSSFIASPKPVVYLDRPSESPAKKSVPTPIFIPDPKLDDFEIRCESVKANDKLKDPPQKYMALMDPSSPGSETLSAVSGTTLARALIANSFVLSSGERMNSYPRSAVSRQDSATLPRELPPLPLGFGVGDIQRSSSVPPVPPLQSNALLEQRRSCISGSTMMGMKPSSVGLHTNTENASSEYSSTDVYPLTPPELVLHSGQPRRISPISEVPSASNAPMSLKVTRHQDVTSICREIRTRVESEESDDPHPASDILSTPPSSSGVPKPSWSTTDSSQTDPSSPVDHSLDEYSFVPPGLHTAMLSSGSDSSASFIMSSPIKRNDSNIRRRPMKAGAGGTVWRGTGTRTRTPYQRNKKQIRLLPIVHSSEPQSVFTPTMMASSISRSSLSHLPLVPSSAVPAGHLEMPPTAREGIDQDYGEFFDYAITVSPDLGSSSHYTSSSSAGYQTFPETPMFSPALFSPDYLRAQAPTLRTQRPPLPRSATLPSPRECIAWGKSGPAKSTVNSTQSQNEDVGSPRRPQSIASLNYTTPSPFSGSEPLGSSPLSASSTSSIQSSFSQSSTPLTTPPCTTDSVTVAASVPLSESTTNSPHRLSFSDDFSSSTLSSVDSQSPSRARTIASPPNFVTSFLPTLAPTPSPPLPPISLRTSTASPLSQSHAPTSCSLSFPSVSASFVDPPSYRTVVPDDQGSTKVPPSDVDHPALLTQPNPVQERDRELPFQIPFSLYPGGRTRGRRPPLPIGPRRPSGPARPLGSFVPGFRERFASESAVAGNNSLENTPTWHKLYEAASKPLPKFQTPPAKWRGLTVEAAQWTLTSSQLQNVISRAIKQSAEGSSIRLLCLETLDGEIAEETHRLEMLHTDIKFRYKALVRKRWQLLGALAGHLEDAVTVGTASRTLEELADVTLEHDQLADELHCTAEQLSQLKSLRDIHHSSALAMALRKVNSAFLHQVEEKQKLHERIEALEAERDEGWKQAEDVAMEYDRMVEASRGPATRATNRRSAHVSAVRKSSIRRSKAGLRLSSSRRSSANNASGTRCSMPGPRSTFEDIPAVPPIPLSQSSATTLTSGVGSMYHSGSSAARALAHAQQELYGILGLDFQNTPSSSMAPSRPRSASKPSDLIYPPVNLRRLSDGEITHSLRTRRAHENRLIRSEILDDRKVMLAALGLMSN